jgi:hypothetical protein
MRISAWPRQTFIALVAAVIAFAPASALAQINNGSFEAAFQSWTQTGDTFSVGASVEAVPAGSLQALLASATDGSTNGSVGAGTGVAASVVETALSLPLGKLASAGNGTPLLCSAINQDAVLLAGQRITFSWDFLTNQAFLTGSFPVAPDPANNDFAFVSVVRNGTVQFTKLADVFDSGLVTSSATDPFASHTTYRTYSFTAPADGTYRLGIGVVHVSTTTPDNGVNSGLLVDNVQVAAPAFDFQLLAPTVYGGAGDKGNVSLPVNTGGSYTVTTSIPSYVQVPAGAVTVPNGSYTSQFSITTAPVPNGQSQPGTISVTYSGQTIVQNITVIPPVFGKLQILTPSVTGGQTANAAVVLNGATNADVTVSLSSDNAAATVPATVTILAGTGKTYFSISTSVVNSLQTANISATSNGVVQTAALTINPAVASSLLLNPATLVGGKVVNSPNYSTGTIILTGNAGNGGITVTLSSSNIAAVVNASVLVQAGQKQVNFPITTVAVDTTQVATISATANGVQKTADLTITPPPLVNLTIAPSAVAGGIGATGTAILDSAAGPSGITVTLSSNNAAAGVPASVQVASGQNKATFSVTTTTVDASQTVTITASAGAVTKTATIAVNVPVLTSLTISPNSVKGGVPTNGIVKLTSVAGPSGVVVTLSSDNGSAVVPVSVTIPAGSLAKSFPITTSAVGVQTVPTITATFNGVQKTATVTLTP